MGKIIRTHPERVTHTIVIFKQFFHAKFPKSLTTYMESERYMELLPREIPRSIEFFMMVINSPEVGEVGEIWG